MNESKPATKTSAPTLLSRYWHVILFMLVCSIVAVRLNREPARRPTQPFDETPAVTERPQRASEPVAPPENPALRRRPLTEESDETNSRAQEALRVLVQNHPAEEVRVRLNAWIMDGRVWLNFQRSALDRYDVIAAAMYVHTPDRGNLLTLVVSPELLLDPTQNQSFKQLVIFHEYVHIRQQIQGTFPPAILMTSFEGRPSASFIRLWLQAEFEAYEEECQLAVRLNMSNAFEICRVFAESGRANLRRTVVATLANVPAYADHSDLIRQVGATLIGD